MMKITSRNIFKKYYKLIKISDLINISEIRNYSIGTKNKKLDISKKNGCSETKKN